jgi:S-adenosylmethionine hydrolase
LLLTLTSDIGRRDYLVGAVKGLLLKTNPDFRIADITHEISPFNFPQAAYICRNAVKSFPDNTFHIILVNLFDQKPEHLLMAYHQNQYYACADNGLLTMILESKPEKVVAIPLDRTEQRNTLYCSEVFARAINDILSGKKMEQIGTPDFSMLEKNPLKALLGPNWMEGQIIFIDNFENVVVNITKEEFEEQRRGRSFKIIFKRDEMIEKISETYADSLEGEKLAMFNSAGYLEIAINKGNAAGLFGLQGYSEKQQQQNMSMRNRLFYQTVRIQFE